MTAVPGWYADPSAAGMTRYWDGAAWTEHVQPISAPAYAPYPTYAPQQSYNRYALAAPVKNGKATSALVWGIVSLLINPFAVPSILAIVFGAQGRKTAEQLEAAGQRQSGRPRATTGLVLGIVGAVFFVVWVVFSLNHN